MTYEINALNALSDPTRRRVFELVAARPRSVASLRRELSVTQPAVSHHLKVLKAARLVRMEARGASNIYYIDPHGLAQVRMWLDRMWDEALGSYAQQFNTQEDE